jgi:uncharacterized protein (TIGR03663 family)
LANFLQARKLNPHQMPDQIRRDIDEWHLGLESGEPRLPEAPPPSRETDTPTLSAERLDAPLYVVTVEHLGWAIIALYALITRLGALGLRPLNSVEAYAALFARDITDRGMAVLALDPRASGWLDPLRAGVFFAFGASDFGARIVAAMFGLLLIGAALAMRRHLGRAGALAFAAMLTLSPTLTYFSRSTSAAVPAIALAVVAIALIFALVGTSDTLKVASLAISIALALSAEPMVFPIAAMFVAILLLMGLFELIFRRNSMLRFRVWWERRSAHLIFGVAIAVGLFVVFESALGRRNLLLPIVMAAMQQWLPVLHPDVRGGLDFYLSAFTFYEFAIAISASLGLVAFLLFQLRSRIAVFAFLWTIFAVAFFLADPVHSHDWLVMMIVPAALMGAAAIDRIHRTDAWLILRYPIGVLVLLTIYVQLAINFVHVAPEPAEASWSRHMLLYWTDPATTILAEQEFSHAERAVSDRGMVFLAAQGPVAQWYLRNLKPADSISNADLVVSPLTAEKQPNLLESSEFTLDEKWDPRLARLTPETAMRYFFTQRIWSDVSANEVRVDVRGPTPAPVPSASPSPSESPTAEASMTPTPSPEATSSPTAEPTTSPTPPPTPTAVSTPAPTAATTSAPTPTP